MTQKIVILGSNSFSGAHFADHCLSEGFEVTGISRSPQPDRVFLPYSDNANLEKFSFIQADLNKDTELIASKIKKLEADYIVNFAAQGMVAQSWDNPGHWLMTNTVSQVRLHNLIKDFDFLKKYVQISTPEVYGSTAGAIKENTTYNPSTPYAVSKAACDMSLMTFYRNYGFPVVFTRAANVYGAGQQLYRIIPITILKFLTGGKLQLHGGGHSTRSFIHIKDVAKATLKVMLNADPGDIFHLSTTENISIRNLVEKIAEQLGADFEEYVEVADERPGKDASYCLDSTKAREELQWDTSVSLDEGLNETVGWVRMNLDKLKNMPWKYIHKE